MKSLVILLALVQSIAFARMGNEGSGGGNTLPNTPATRTDIDSFAKSMHQYMLSGFTQIMMIPKLQLMVGYQDEFKFDQKTIQLAEDLNKKLSEQSLPKLIQSIKVEVTLDKPCYDSLNYNPPQPREASADIRTQTICFSPSEVLKKSIPLNQLYHKLTALFVHEAAHLIGYDEDSAEVFQIALEKMMRGYSREEMEKYKGRAYFYVSYDTPDLIDVIHNDLNHNKPIGQVCFRLGQLEQIVLGDRDNIEGSLVRFGLSIFNLQTFKLAQVIREPVDVMEAICKQQQRHASEQTIRDELIKLDQVYKNLALEMQKPPFVAKEN